jgi:hypothetical protein
MLGQTAPPAAPTESKLVYADFENCTDDHLQSNRGGYVGTAAWQELDRLKASVDPIFVPADGVNFSNRMAFNFKIDGPQKYAGASLNINGYPEVAKGKPQPEDLSGYKELIFDAEVVGPKQLKVQLMSQNTSISVWAGNEPFVYVDIEPGFRTYHVQMKKFDTPRGAPIGTAVAKDVLKNVTGIQFVIDKQGSAGHVIIDNVIFQK